MFKAYLRLYSRLSLIILLDFIQRQVHFLQYTGQVLDNVTLSMFYEGLGSPVVELNAPLENWKDSVIHDEESLTAFLWKEGKFVEGMQHRVLRHVYNEEGNKLNQTIDALTVGQVKAEALVQAQVNSWGHHVRFFFGGTENDDTDPNCTTTTITSLDQVFEVVDICRDNRAFGYEMRAMPILSYAGRKWLIGKPNPIGWLCAQQRFASVIGKIGKFYQRELVQAMKSGSQARVLPEFLLIQDDDTYYNMNLLRSDVFSKIDPSTVFVSTGCLVQTAVHIVNFSFPYGGFGTILSRGALLRLIRPIYCNGTSTIPSENQSLPLVNL